MEYQELFTRDPANPILTAKDMPFPCKAVCNPAACVVDGETVLLLRAIGVDDVSHVVVARSRDGVTGWRVQTNPLLSPTRDDADWYEAMGCEDPRLCYLAEIDQYVVSYVGVSHFGAGVCLATTHDFHNVARFGLVIHPYNKDAALFPRKIGGRFLLLHRPTSGPQENIWLSESDDLRHWGNPRCVLEEADKPGWDNGKVGAGPTPIETPEGWLLIFHGVERLETSWLYRVGLALLDLDDPSRIVRRLPHWIFGPMEPYEMRDGQGGVVFPTGATVQDGVVRMYYGGGDVSVGVATARIDDLLAALREHGTMGTKEASGLGPEAG